MSIPQVQLDRAIPRDAYLKDIETAIADLGQHNRNILVYYGEPSLTWNLSRSLYRTLNKQGRLCTRVDGAGLKAQTVSALETGLRLLRNELGQGGVDFSCYDIAYWCYWSALNPHLAIDSVEFTQKMSRANKLSAFADLVGATQDLNLSGVLRQMQIAEITDTARALIPQMMNDVGQLAVEALPFGVFTAKLAVFFVGLDERHRIWWQERGNADLRELKDECDSPFDVLPRLPLFLARDLKHHFRRTDLPLSQQTAVIFVDGYEELVENASGHLCPWLEAMLAQEEASPYVLWVITAQRPLPWMEDARQVPVTPLSEAVSDQVLATAGIQSEELRRVIVQAAQGSPWYLEVCFNAWQRLRKQRLPQPEDFTQQLADVLQREDQTWDSSRRQLHQLLAVPRYWENDLSQQLVSHFLETSPDEATRQQQLTDLENSPYVLNSDNDIWRWHPDVRSYLLSSQPQDRRQAIHRWLFEYYRTEAQDVSQSIVALEEALYHGLNLNESQEALDWFLEAILVPIQQRPHPAIPSLLRPLLTAPGVSLQQQALAQTRLGQALAALYEWEDAQLALAAALKQWDSLQQADTLAAAEAWHVLSEVYLALENPFDALKAAQNAVRLRANLLGKESLAYAYALSRQAEASAAINRVQDAMVLSQQAVDIAAASAETTPLQLLLLQWTATLVRFDRNTLDQAEQSCRSILASLAQLPGGEDHWLMVRSYALLGDIYRLMGPQKGQQAFDCYQVAIEKAEWLWGADSPWILQFMDAQLRLCRKLGANDAADEIASRRQLYAQSSDWASMLEAASSMTRVGMTLFKKGEYGKAEPRLKRALAVRKRLLVQPHPDVAASLNNLALLYQSQGRYGEAEPLYQEALAIGKRLLGEEHPDVAIGLSNLASLYDNEGRYGEAEPLCQQALAMQKQLLGDEHPDVARSLNNLASLYDNEGRYGEAEPLYLQALAMKKRLFGGEHPDVALSLNNLAKLYANQGRYGEAEPICQEALAMRKRLLGDEHPDVAISLNNLAFLYYSQERYGEAELLYQQALVMKKRLLGNEHPDVATSLNNLAGLYDKQRRYEEAEPLYQEALAMNKQLLGESHPKTIATRQNLERLRQNHESVVKGYTQ
jgi:tetratricopeptide (TPR) repeat protein